MRCKTEYRRFIHHQTAVVAIHVRPSVMSSMHCAYITCRASKICFRNSTEIFDSISFGYQGFSSYWRNITHYFFFKTIVFLHLFFFPPGGVFYNTQPPPHDRACHWNTCVRLKPWSPKPCWIISRVYVALFPRFAQNLMLTRCSFLWSIAKYAVRHVHDST
jgi:hypothetical protein